MARPKKEGMDYFPHDTDAVNDEKIEALRLLYGNDGYAFYFILLERIYRSKEFEIDVSDAETIQILSRKISITEKKFIQILKTALKRNCFDAKVYAERGVLTSNGIKKRADIVVDKRIKMQEKYKQDKGLEEKPIISDIVSDAETQQKPDKVKESKVKKRKEKKDIKPSRHKYETCDIEMAELLFARMKENNPEVKQPNLESWANEVRLMRQQDKRTIEQIRYLIEWTQKDSFWRSNVLSIAKLRKQYDPLVLKVKENRQKGVITNGPTEDAKRLAEEYNLGF